MDPDYSKYSISELKEALASVDKELYPERYLLIREEISKKEKSSEPTKNNKKSDLEYKSPDYKEGLFQSYFFFKKNVNVLRTLTLLFGVSLFINYLFSLNISAFSYKIALSFPGIKNIDKSSILTLFTILVIVINTFFLISAIGSYFNKKIFNILLALSWGVMTIGFEIWIFKWWPTPIFDIPLAVKFSLFSIPFGLKVNMFTLFFFIWASLMIPEFRKELYK